LTLDPRAPVAANNLAWMYVAANRNLDQALQLAQIAQQELPNEPGVNDTLGWIYYRKGMATQALPYLETSVRGDPTDAMTQYHLGMAYFQKGDFENAKKALRRAMAFKTEFDGAAEGRKQLAQLEN
jgi:Flp pilus assembly protein TadD